MKKTIAFCLSAIMMISCGAGDEPSSKTKETKKIDSKQYELPFSREYSGGSPVVTIKLNGCSISNFIWDTGATMTSISSLEFASLVKNGKITDNDFVGKMKFSNATGGVSESDVYKIKEIAIPCNGGKELKCYDINVAVEENLEAPMLLGQNVMQKLPKCSVNDLKQVIVFE